MTLFAIVTVSDNKLYALSEIQMSFQSLWYIHVSDSFYPLQKEREIQVHNCTSGELIFMIYVGDGKVDCLSGDDENTLACAFHGKMQNSSFCRNNCFAPACKCSDLYFQTMGGGCFAYNRTCDNECLLLLNNNADINVMIILSILLSFESTILEKQPRPNRQSYFYTDCTKLEIDNMQFAVSSKTKCKSPEEMPCTYGCSRCFPVHKLCVYQLDESGSMMYCPSGAHLKNCDMMECNRMFKCPDHYCIYQR